MFRIGDFSRLSQVSVKALRHYDELGLLRPAEIDPFTGYRYYSADQLPRLNRIIALKNLGLSLEQVARMLDEGLSLAEMRGMLRIRQADLQRQIGAEREQLARVEARLKQIEQEGTTPIYEVVLKRIEPQTAVTIRDVLPTHGDVQQLFNEVFNALGEFGLKPTGPSLAIYYDTEYRERNVDVEIGIPVRGVLPDNERLKIRELPGVEAMACVVHQGSYDTFFQVYAALMAWIEANSYHIANPTRMIYLRGRWSESTPQAYVTEVQFPVEKT